MFRRCHDSHGALRQALFEAMGGRGGRGPRGGWGGPGGAGGPSGGPGGFDGGPFGGRGEFFPFGRGRGDVMGGGPRARRGDTRAAILALLAEQPHNGYQIMQALDARSEGAWRPSPGAVYPALQQLEDEGLIVAEAVGNGKTFSLTDAGRQYVAEHADEVRAPWEAMTADEGDARQSLRPLIHQVLGAVRQVAMAGTPAQIEEARKLLVETRRGLYRLLADDEAE